MILNFIYRDRDTGKLVREKYGMIDFGKNIIIIWILDKSRSVAPAKLEIKLVSPYQKYHVRNTIYKKMQRFFNVMMFLCRAYTTHN